MTDFLARCFVNAVMTVFFVGLLMLYRCISHVEIEPGIRDDLRIDISALNNGQRFGGVFSGACGVASCAPHKPSDNPEPAGSEEQRPREPGYPPVWRRIPTALILGLGSNIPYLQGLVRFDSNKRLGAALCILGIGMMVSGCALMLCLGIPATWGWWI